MGRIAHRAVGEYGLYYYFYQYTISILELERGNERGNIAIGYFSKVGGVMMC